MPPGGTFTFHGGPQPQSAGLVINATFDTSITSNVNAAQIEASINQAVGIFEQQFSDPITVSIFFRYSTTAPNGSPLSGGTLAQSAYVIYNGISWSTFKNALIADAKTANDATANASLPGTALSANVIPSSANGRAVGMNTPPAMFPDGHVGTGGPYDGIVTLNSAQPFQFDRIGGIGAGNFDAQRSTEHEMDEVLGLGSFIGGSNVRPQDLFSWSSSGTRNLTSSGSRYFSINGGATDIVGFNQQSGGDFGDWLSGSCPQTTPYVQNAFSCPGQMSDVTATSPEGINLDVIGYDLVRTSHKTLFDFDGDGKTDVSIWRGTTGVWWIIDSSTGSFTPTGWGVPGAGDIPVPGDYDGDGKTDIAIWRATTGDWWIINSSDGSITHTNWGLTGVGDIPVPGDYDGDGKTDIAIWRATTGDWWIINSSNGSITHKGWGLPGAGDIPVPGDYDGDSKTDVAIWRATTGDWWILNSSNGSITHTGWGLPGAGDIPVPGDYDGDGKTDIAIWRATTADWWIINSSNGSITHRNWGLTGAGDVPVPGDYDGDGKTDIAIWRATTADWWIINSSNGSITHTNWGLPGAGDIPVPSTVK
jgi:hypothetical protein